MTQSSGSKVITGTQAKIVIPENVNEFYANAIFPGFTDWDFMILFGSLGLPTGITTGTQTQRLSQEVRIDVVVRMSPQQAKACSIGLNRSIKDYEAKYGEIRIPPEVLNADKQT